MIPSLDARGLLPPGIHTSSLGQFRAVFGTNFRREQLLESLGRCLVEMRKDGLAGTVLLDGSFVTDKDSPRDIELCLDVRRQSREVQDRALIFFSRRHAEFDRAGIDWYPTLPAGSDFTLYFQYVGEKTAAERRCKATDLKGIVRLTRW